MEHCESVGNVKHGRGFEVVSYITLEDSGIEPSEVKLPVRGSAYSAGYDLHVVKHIEIPANGEVYMLPTGIKAYMQPDEYMSLEIRSSVGVKQRLMLAHGRGIIDSDYYNNFKNDGHIFIPVFNAGKNKVILEAGQRIAQGIFHKYLEANDASTMNDIRLGGFGSSGNQ